MTCCDAWWRHSGIPRAVRSLVLSCPNTRKWAASYCPDATRMNIGSDAQKAHFLFAPTTRAKRGRQAANPDPEKDVWPQDRAFKVGKAVDQGASFVSQ